MSSQRRNSASQVTARRRLWKARIQRFLLICFFLQLIVVGGGLFFTGNFDFIFPQKDVVMPVVALEKNNPVTENKINNTGEDKQNNSSENGVMAPKNISAAAAVVEKTEKISIKVNLPELQEQVRQNSTLPVLTPVVEPEVIAESAGETIGRETASQYYYIVKAGDSLGLISQKVYGTSTNWRIIADANSDQLGNNPNRLQLKMALVIPSKSETGDMLLQPDAYGFLKKGE